MSRQQRTRWLERRSKVAAREVRGGWPTKKETSFSCVTNKHALFPRGEPKTKVEEGWLEKVVVGTKAGAREIKSAGHGDISAGLELQGEGEGPQALRKGDILCLGRSTVPFQESVLHRPLSLPFFRARYLLTRARMSQLGGVASGESSEQKRSRRLTSRESSRTPFPLPGPALAESGPGEPWPSRHTCLVPPARAPAKPWQRERRPRGREENAALQSITLMEPLIGARLGAGEREGWDGECRGWPVHGWQQASERWRAGVPLRVGSGRGPMAG